MTTISPSPRAAAPLVAAFAVGALGIAVFSAMDAVIKGLVIAIGVYQTMFWRSLAAIGLSGALYGAVRTGRPSRAAMRLHVLRGLVSVVMGLAFFWGLARVPMAQAIALAFIAPVLALLLSALILKEAVARGTMLACGIAFAGLVVILAGQARAEAGPEVVAGTVAVLGSAVCYAFNIVLMRAQAQAAGPVEVAFWQNLIVGACLALAAPWLASVPDARHAPMLLLAAGLVTLSLLLLGWAYARAPASYLAPTEYTSFVWASLLGWMVFGETLSAWTVAGAVLIVAGCLVAARQRPPALPSVEIAA